MEKTPPITMKKSVSIILAIAALVAAISISCIVTSSALADETNTQEMYRLYNPNSGEHFYTASDHESQHLQSVGWNYEGIGWVAPQEGEDVYRLYNPNAGDHHYTLSKAEKDMLVSIGWNYEGVGWKSDVNHSIPLYRQYNPNAIAGSHNYTTSTAERDMLISAGWHNEDIAWYAVGEGRAVDPNNNGALEYDELTDEQKEIANEIASVMAVVTSTW